uniref:Uncharacterized protein n=1 Tax=Octopus bimaculoides TaxID=37653 RepID=A0A0L8HI51_OCTBM
MRKQTNNSNNNNIEAANYNDNDDHQQMQQPRVPSALSEGAVTSIWTEMMAPSYVHCLPKALLETDLSQNKTDIIFRGNAMVKRKI